MNKDLKTTIKDNIPYICDRDFRDKDSIAFGLTQFYTLKDFIEVTK